MGRSYKIQCKQCGTQFLQSADSGYGVMPTCIGCGAESTPKEGVIRCPGCQRLVNGSREELMQQVIEETFWE